MRVKIDQAEIFKREKTKQGKNAELREKYGKNRLKVVQKRQPYKIALLLLAHNNSDSLTI